MTNAIHLLSDQPWVERLGWTLVHFLWQGAFIAMIYAVARRAGPRYALACAALIALIAAPVVTFRVLTPSESASSNPYIGRVPASSAVAPAVGSAVVSPAVISQARRDAMMPWVVLVWFAGAIVFWIRLAGGWIIAARMRRMFVRPAPAEWQETLDGIRARIGVSRPVRLLVSALVQVPTVVGWLRPIVLMPIGALAGLPAEHVEMLLAHELAHIRRHDCLVSVLQSIAEALLFYHPAVWWISGHIRSEREVCCDDVAVSVGGDAFTYARALAELELRRPAYLNPALAANGGSLPERIGRLLNQPVRDTRSRSGAAVAATVLLALGAWGLLAQSPPPHKVFEAVSIKPNELGGGHIHSNSPGPGRLNASMTTKAIIEMAYALKSFQVEGGPKWLDEINYNIVATTGDGTVLSDRALAPYLQSMLTDRFHLVYHRETKEFPVYALVAARGGTKLTPHSGTVEHGTDSEGHNGLHHMHGTDLTMADFASFLARQTDRPVIDQSEIQGTYDMKLEWSTNDADPTLPPLFTALQEQLGLRLNATKGPVEVLVVDSADQPEN